MKILQICPHYIPAHRFGGPQHVAHGLGKALAKAGHKVTVCTTNLADEVTDLDVELDTPINVDGVNVFYESTKIFRYWGFSPALFKRSAREIRKADIILIHAHYQFANLAGSWLSRYYKKPYIIFSHGSLHRQGILHKNGKTKGLYLRFVEKKNFQKALFVAFNASEELKYSYFNEFGRVVPNGIDLQVFSKMPPRGYFLSQYKKLLGKTIFLFLGRLDVEHKGLDLLIPAFAKLIKKQPYSHLVLAGPDEDNGEKKLRALIKHNQIMNNVTFTGVIAGDDKLGALQDSHVFVLPSRFEGMSIALLEALYMGLPMLITDQVGLNETVKKSKAGVVIPAGEEDSIYNGLLMLSDSEVRSSMNAKGTEMVLKNYTWDVIAFNLIAYIKTKNKRF